MIDLAIFGSGRDDNPIRLVAPGEARGLGANVGARRAAADDDQRSGLRSRRTRLLRDGLARRRHQNQQRADPRQENGLDWPTPSLTTHASIVLKEPRRKHM